MIGEAGDYLCSVCDLAAAAGDAEALVVLSDRRQVAAAVIVMHHIYNGARLRAARRLAVTAGRCTPAGIRIALLPYIDGASSTVSLLSIR